MSHTLSPTSPTLPASDAPPTATGATGQERDLQSILQMAVPLIAWGALLCAVAWPMLRWWYWEYSKPESYYGYAMFVPPLIGLMLWHRRKALAETPKAACPWALAVLIPALALLVFAVKNDLQAVMSTGFLLSLTASVWFVWGTKVVRAAWFPLLFGWLMAPLPGPFLNDLTIGVQGLSTTGATKLLTLLMLHPQRHGNVIQLDNFTMHVDVACSGFKLLLTLFTFSSAFAFLTDTTTAKRWALFLLSLPLAIVVNSIRIAMFGLVGEGFGESAAKTFHDWSGLISLVLCMTALFGAAKVLGCRTFAGQRIF